jgi:aryl-alcohol dehydrogenase-like predicted oxidoreductase
VAFLSYASWWPHRRTFCKVNSVPALAAGHASTARGVAVLEALDTVADAHGAEPATVALAWLLTRPTVVAPIASARNLEQLPALLAVQDLTLTDEDIRLLTKASA